MKIQKTAIIQNILIIELLLPFCAIVVFALTGFFFNFNNYFFVCNTILLILLLFEKKISKNNLIFFCFFLFILCLNYFSFISHLGFATGSFEFLRNFSSYYFFIFLGFILYRYYYQTGKEKVLLKLVVKIGLFISIINFSHFVLLITDNVIVKDYVISFERYNIIYKYLKILNPALADYIVIGYHYDGIYRPVGYFFDTHSQYYLPLGALVILLFKEFEFKHKKLVVSFMLLSVLISGIKTAYLTIIFLGAIYLITNFQSKMFMKYLKIISLSLIGVFLILNKYILLIFGGEGLYKILLQLSNHFIQIPAKLLQYEQVAFLFGGAPFLRNDKFFYSELFFVTVTFYIGLVGLALYLLPIILLAKIKSVKLPAYIFLLFILSLSHYSVYMIGINNLFSALTFMYFFALINNETTMGSISNSSAPFYDKK